MHSTAYTARTKGRGLHEYILLLISQVFHKIMWYSHLMCHISKLYRNRTQHTVLVLYNNFGIQNRKPFTDSCCSLARLWYIALQIVLH